MSKIAGAMAALGVVAGLGVAALPMASYAAESAPVTIRTIVDSSIAVTTADTVVDLGTVNGSAIGNNVTTVTVTGTVAKYNLGVMDEDDNNAMVWVSDAGTDQSDATKTGTTIGAITGSDLTGGWGFRLNNEHVTAGAWAGVPVYNATGAASNLVSNADLTDGEQQNIVEFGVDITGLTTIKNGLYEDDVIFVATAGA